MAAPSRRHAAAGEPAAFHPREELNGAIRRAFIGTLAGVMQGYRGWKGGKPHKSRGRGGVFTHGRNAPMRGSRRSRYVTQFASALTKACGHLYAHRAL